MWFWGLRLVREKGKWPPLAIPCQAGEVAECFFKTCHAMKKHSNPNLLLPSVVRYDQSVSWHGSNRRNTGPGKTAHGCTAVSQLAFQ